MTGWWATLSDAERAAVKLTLKPDEVFMHRAVSDGMLSVARHSYGCTINRQRYVYMPATDDLVRHDVLALVACMRRLAQKQDRRESREAAQAAQPALI